MTSNKKLSAIKLFTPILIVGLGLFFCFYKLGDYSLHRWDEQTNKSVVEQINNSGNLLELKTENGYFFEKPPLWYILTAVTVKVIGTSNFSLRFISALSGFLLVIGLSLFMLKEYSLKSAILTSLTFFSTVQLFFFSPGRFFSTHTFHSADLDSLQIMLIVFSLIGYSYYLKGSKKMGLVASFLTGLAVLTKGPLGFTPLLLLFIFLLYKKKLSKYKTSLLEFFAITIIVIAPWYIFMTYKFGGSFIYEHFGYQIIDRILTPLEGHGASIWHYLYMLCTGKLAPSIILILPLLYTQVKRFKKLDFLTWTSLVFVVGYFALISVMQTKLAWYLLPLYPFIAILIGEWGSGLKLQISNYKQNKLETVAVVTTLLPLVVYTAINIYGLLVG